MRMEHPPVGPGSELPDGCPLPEGGDQEPGR